MIKRLLTDAAILVMVALMVVVTAAALTMNLWAPCWAFRGDTIKTIPARCIGK